MAGGAVISAPAKNPVAQIDQFLGLRTDTKPSKTPADYSPDCSDLVFSPGGMATRNPFRRVLTLPAKVVYRKEFLAKNGTTQVLALDVTGKLYVIHSDGTYTLLDTVTPGCRANSVTAYGREYIAFFDANNEGCDDPRQWDGRSLSRVTQGGPGAPPTFTPAPPSGNQYAITSITQPAAQTWGSSYFLQSKGVGNNTDAGSNVTVYYGDHTAGASADADLEGAFNSGEDVYLRASFTGTPETLGPWTVKVTSVGYAQPPGQPHSFYYFTFELPTSTLIFYPGSGNPGYTANYQRTLATLTTATPVPELSVDDTVALFGSSASGYDGYQKITQALNSAGLAITQTSVTAGVATYHYIIQSGTAAPSAGQSVTIKGTLNANGALDGTNLTIASAAGADSGTFTVAGFAVPDASAVAEQATAVTAGAVFSFDPGVEMMGGVQNPIVGNSSGGTLVFSGSNSTIASGTRQGVVFFILDDDSFTPPSIIAKFTVPANTPAIAYSNLPIGPPNVKARGLAFTGANGGKFFFMDVVPQENGKILGTSTRIDDNTTTSGTVWFDDRALDSAIAIDVPGNNMFVQVPLNLPRGVDWYGDRLLWIGEKNTVLGFQNMGMDGGTLSGSGVPLGWNAVGAGSVQQSGIMPAYSVDGPETGQITQGAYQTAAGVAILQPKQNYSLRFWSKANSAYGGALVATISSQNTGFTTTARLGLANVTLDGFHTISFDQPMPDIIPPDMLFSIAFENLGGTAFVRQFQMIYADNPNRNPIARFSYTQNPTAYDAVTGNAGPNDDPTELRATAVLQESLYFITQRGLYRIEQIGNTEPSSWDPQQNAQDCGAFDANSVVTGKGWIAWAGPEGIHWFGGGIPEKISSTIAPTWRTVKGVTDVFNDIDAERVYFGTVDSAGAAHLMVYDYHEIHLGGPGKWTPWNRPVSWVSASSSGPLFAMNKSFYRLDTASGATDDDLGDIGGYYTFAPVGFSLVRKSFYYMGLEISGSGILTPFISKHRPSEISQTLEGADLAALKDVVAEWNVDVDGRFAFLKVGQPGVQFEMQSFAMVYQQDPNQPTSGVR